MTLEICCADIESVQAAVEGGCGRIELCSALESGGVTPSAGLIIQAVSRCRGRVPVHVLIRPRPGDFLYSEAELQVMEADILAAVRYGASGIVIGALTPDGHVDTAACRRMMSSAGNASVSVTFHRAFDMCSEPFQAIDDIAALGCDRILTSGQALSALDGSEAIRRFSEYAAGRVSLIAGAGINSRNIREVIRLTGVDEVHASAKSVIRSRMQFQRGNVTMGKSDTDEYSRTATSADEVGRMVEIIDKLSNTI